jgi:transcriptional regulator with XRE-family HTH domain
LATPKLTPEPYVSPGERLKARRRELRLSLRDVQLASLKIAADERNDEYAISIGRLSAIETKHAVPGIYRLASLARIYRLPLPTILGFFDIQRD